MSKTFALAFLSLALNLPVFAFAEPAQQVEKEDPSPALERSFSLSSGYLERAFNSNEGLSYFPLSAIQLYSKAFDGVTGGPASTAGGRLAVVLLELPVTYWFSHAIFIPYHEFGHARAMAASNNDYTYTSYGWGTSGTTSSFWGLTLARLFTPPFGFPSTGIASTNYTSNNNLLTPELNSYYGPKGWDVVVSAGGLNNQMLLSKKIADVIYEKNGHITYFQHYMGNKIATYAYSKMDQNDNFSDDPATAGLSDIGAILGFYATKSYGITHSDLETQSLVSLLSGTTFSFLRGYYNYVSKGDPTVQTAEIAGFRIPDINAYINARGLSYEVVTGYRFSSNLRVDLAYEQVWKGQAAQQFTPKVHYQLASVFPQLNDFWVSMDLVIGGGVGGSLEAQWTPHSYDSEAFSKRLSYFTRFIVYNAYTLYGERNTPSFVNKDVTPELIAGLSYRY